MVFVSVKHGVAFGELAIIYASKRPDVRGSFDGDVCERVTDHRGYRLAMANARVGSLTLRQLKAHSSRPSLRVIQSRFSQLRTVQSACARHFTVAASNPPETPTLA